MCFQPAVIPSLLQTAEYARLALAVGRDVEAGDVARRQPCAWRRRQCLSGLFPYLPEPGYNR